MQVFFLYIFLSKARSVACRAAGGLSLLPATRKPLWLRFGEQNLHMSAVGFRPLCRSAALALCSPLPANPCSSVSGSKIFTFPPPDFALPGARRLFLFAPPLPANPCSSVPGSKIFTFPPPDFSLTAVRRRPLFAPHSPLTLAAPFRGAKSSHFRRPISPSQPPGGGLSLLPATR